MMEMTVKTPDALKVIDQARKIDELEEKLKLADMQRDVILTELHTAALERDELREKCRKYRQDRQAARELGKQIRLQGDRERGDRIKAGLLCAMFGACGALAVVLGIIWSVGL